MKKIFENKKLLIGLSVLTIIVVGVGTYLKDYIPFPNQFYRISDMNIPRQGHHAVLLKDGRVLIIGGSINSSGATTDTAEIYDPVKKKFTLTDKLKMKLSNGYAVTLLSDGKVLISGGVEYLQPTNGRSELVAKIVSTLQIYNPETNKFKLIGNMKMPRKNHTATLLPDGQVLIVGGESTNGTTKFIRNVEVFNPKTNKTRIIGETINSYSCQSAILTKEGVFITGNRFSDYSSKDSELYDFKSGKFIAVGDLNISRGAPELILLKNGDVLIFGGTLHDEGKNSVEVYHHDMKNIDELKNVYIRESASATLLKDGNILFTGGSGPGLDISFYKKAEIYDTNSKTFTKIGNMKKVRAGQTSTILNNGTVLITGGGTCDKVLKSSEIYNYKD